MTTDSENTGRREGLSLLADEDRERIAHGLTACEPGPLPTGFGFVEPPPPYQPGPRRKLPAWAKHLRHLRPLKLVE